MLTNMLQFIHTKGTMDLSPGKTRGYSLMGRKIWPAAALALAVAVFLSIAVFLGAEADVSHISPQTGDYLNVAIIVSLLALAAVAVLLFIGRKKSR